MSYRIVIHWNREIRGVVKRPSSEAFENRLDKKKSQGWTRRMCTFFIWGGESPRDGMAATRQKKVCCWRAEHWKQSRKCS